MFESAVSDAYDLEGGAPVRLHPPPPPTVPYALAAAGERTWSWHASLLFIKAQHSALELPARCRGAGDSGDDRVGVHAGLQPPTFEKASVPKAASLPSPAPLNGGSPANAVLTLSSTVASF